MTTELRGSSAGEEELRVALLGLAADWADVGRVPSGLFAARARQAWRRRVAAVAASSALVVGGVVAVGFAVGPSLHAGVRPVTISASSPPATPPTYAGYTADPLGVVSHPKDGIATVRPGPRLPDFLPVVNASGLVGLTDDPQYVPGASMTVIRDLDVYSDGGPTDQGFGVTIAGIRFEGDVSGRGPGKPLVLSWFQPSAPLAVGQVLYAGQDGPGAKVAGRIPVGTITKLLPSIYPDKHDARAQVASFADLAHPGQVWALRKPGDDVVPSVDTGPTFPLPGEKHLSPMHKLLTVGGFTVSDYASVDATTGKPVSCTTIVRGTSGDGPDCRTAAKLGRDSLAVDRGGSYAGPFQPIVVVGRAGTAVVQVVVVLDDGTRITAEVADGGTAYPGRYFAASWTGKVPADTALAYDADGKQVGTTTTYYGGGGGF